MKTGTSPAITALDGDGYEAAFQASTGFLWVVPNGTGQNTELGMLAKHQPRHLHPALNQPPRRAGRSRRRERPVRVPATEGQPAHRSSPGSDENIRNYV